MKITDRLQNDWNCLLFFWKHTFSIGFSRVNLRGFYCVEFVFTPKCVHKYKFFLRLYSSEHSISWRNREIWEYYKIFVLERNPGNKHSFIDDWWKNLNTIFIQIRRKCTPFFHHFYYSNRWCRSNKFQFNGAGRKISITDRRFVSTENSWKCCWLVARRWHYLVKLNKPIEENSVY